MCGVIHNDIKAENLYVLGASNEDDDRDAKTLLEKAHAKVIDLGMAMYPHGEPKRAEGAEAFAAPELLRSNFKTNSPKNAVLIEGPLPIATKEMDVYRLGVSLLALLRADSFSRNSAFAALRRSSSRYSAFASFSTSFF